MRGRVMALYLMIFMGGTPLGSPFIGWIGELFGARWTLLSAASMTILGVLAASAVYLWTRRLTRSRVEVRTLPVAPVPRCPKVSA